MQVVVVTGGVGSGKSTFCDALAELGVPIIDTDRIAHELTSSMGDAMPAIHQRFGAGFMAPDGSLDRAKTRTLVFADPEARADLESILHPRIHATVMARLAALPPSNPYAVVVIPLFFERGSFADMGWYIVTIDTTVDAQLARVTARPGITHETARAIVDAQVPREKRLRSANEVIANTGDLTAFRKEATAFHKRMLMRVGTAEPVSKKA